MERLMWIQGIRGLMCIWVVLFHYTTRYVQIFTPPCNPFYSFENGGEVGVAVFFILSGFFCLKSLENNYDDKKRWLLKRYIRLWPSYIVCSLVTFALLCIVGLPGRDNISILDFLKDIPMLPYLSGNVEHATWYVLSLIKFYILIYILSHFRIFNKGYFYVTILMLFMATIITPDAFPSKIIRTLFGFMPLYAGMCLFKYIQTKRNSFLAIYLLMICYLAFTIHYLYMPIIGIIILLLLLDCNYTKWMKCIFSNRVLCYIGGLSYTWYLIHQNVGYMIIYHFENNIIMPIIAAVFTFVIAVILEVIADRITIVLKNQMLSYGCNKKLNKN